MTLKLVAGALQGNFKDAFNDQFGRVATAATGAINKGAEDLRARARASISSGGFSNKWQNAYRVEVFPRGAKASVDAAIWAWHKIPYAGVFETGATIRGKPMLWLPTKFAPNRIGGKKPTPSLFIKFIGPLRSTKGTKHPMLVAAFQARGRRRKGGPRTVPIFVGVPLVHIPKKFDLEKAAQSVRDQLPDHYFQLLQVS